VQTTLYTEGQILKKDGGEGEEKKREEKRKEIEKKSDEQVCESRE